MRTEALTLWCVVKVRWPTEKRPACTPLRVRAGTVLVAFAFSLGCTSPARAQVGTDPSVDPPGSGTGLNSTEKRVEGPVQDWNWHVQNTDIVQGDFGFPAKYSGPNSLNSGGEVQETITLDLYGGLRLWRGAEAH